MWSPRRLSRICRQERRLTLCVNLAPPIFKGDGSCLMKCLRKGACSRATLSRQAQGACISIRFRPLQACQYSQQDKAARLHYAWLDGP
jgi:hypothetical protein